MSEILLVFSRSLSPCYKTAISDPLSNRRLRSHATISDPSRVPPSSVVSDHSFQNRRVKSFLSIGKVVYGFGRMISIIGQERFQTISPGEFVDLYTDLYTCYKFYKTLV
ncbi:unnamed protein product [Arabis nemorensis]|uniref:Uncharacterized protein n=1 Tax=Arabis nemorensis TaxID=586526 RepID=A0A565CFA7_9BRAS|nr:unnamed protein product [Arabis nemorensis]